jgi:hypothetical protein
VLSSFAALKLIGTCANTSAIISAQANIFRMASMDFLRISSGANQRGIVNQFVAGIANPVGAGFSPARLAFWQCRASARHLFQISDF